LSVRRPIASELWLLLAASVFSAAVGALLWRRLRQTPPEPPPPPQSVVDRLPGYHPTLVDHRGRPLSARPGHVRLVLDPFTGFRNLPGQRMPSFTVDDDGFRGGDRGAPSLPLAFVLGGSGTFGQGVNRDQDTLPSALARRSGRYRFVNAGVVGYESGQELAQMVHDLDGRGPQLYVLFDGWNDLFSHLEGKTLGRRLGVNSYLSDVEARLRALVEAQASELAAASPRPSDLWDRRFESDPGFRFAQVRDAYVANLQRMIAFAHARGADMLVAFQPDVSCKEHPTAAEVQARKSFARYGSMDAQRVGWYRELARCARDASAAAGAVFVDGNDAAFCGTGDELFVDPVHLNARGYDRMASVIQAQLAALPPR